MNCKIVASLISAYLDNELDLQRILDVEAHLEICKHCQNEVLQLTNLSNSIRQSMNYHRVPDSLSLALQKIDGNTEKPKSRFINLWPSQSLLKPLAAFSIVLLSVSLGYQLQPASRFDLLVDEIVSDHIRSLMAAHLTDVASSDQHTVKPWFNGKLDFSPMVIDLSEQGYPLVGGRLDYLAARPVTALVYRRRQHLINVFIWPENQNGLQQEYATTRNGFNVLAFNFQNMNYWLVSDLNKNELMELRNKLSFTK